MNFLAHIYLSGDNDEIKIGNFFADWVKGKQESWNSKYSENIKKGIIIHRFIDTFTDNHEIPRKSSKKFREKYGHYAKVVTDIVYDHYIAYNWHLFSNIELEKYAYDFYKLLIKNFFVLPSQVKIFLPFMIASNRLLTYATVDGIRKTLEIMSKNTSLPNETDFAIEVINSNYEELKIEALEFTNCIIKEVKEKFLINI
jgi:acyl carrier protein phosphodiesterase